MDKKDQKNHERPLSYPRPTETDNQLQNQPEFIEEQPNKPDEGKAKEAQNISDTEEQRGR